MRFHSLLLPALLAIFVAGPVSAQSSARAPLDQLRPEAIDAEIRKFLSVDGLVGFVRGHNRAIAALAFASDDKWLASSSWDNTVRLWRLGEAAPKDWATLPASPSGVAFHPTKPLLALGAPGTGVYLWDVSGAKPVRQHVLAGHKKGPFAIAFAPTGRMLASGCFEPLLRLWKLDDAEPEMWGVLTGESRPSLGLSALAFSHDGKRLFAGCNFGPRSLRQWDVSGPYLEERDLPAARARLVVCAATEPLLAFSGDDAKIRLWRLEGDKVKEVAVLAGHEPRGLPPAVKALAFSPSGKMLASAGKDRRLRIWDTATGQLVREWHLLDEVRALAFSSDNRHLAAGNDDGSTYFLRLAKVP
jgi:WD40 repeat protein